MQPGNRTQVAAHHQQGAIAKRPWHKNLLLCCFAGATKQDDVDDPFEHQNMSAQTGPNGDVDSNRNSTTSPQSGLTYPANSSAPAAAIAQNTRGSAASTFSPAAAAATPAGSRTAAVTAQAARAATPDPPPRAEGPTTKLLLDDVGTDPSVPMFETSSGTADARIAARDLNLGSPLVTPTTSHHALASTAAVAAGGRSDVSAEDLVAEISPRVGKSLGLRPISDQQTGAGAAQSDAGAPLHQQQQHQQQKAHSPFLNQNHQSTVTAELLGMQMQQYLVQHPGAQEQYQLRKSQEQQRRSLSLGQQQEQQEQRGDSSTAQADQAAAVADDEQQPLPALFSRNVAGWDSHRNAAASDGAAPIQQQGLGDPSDRSSDHSSKPAAAAILPPRSPRPSSSSSSAAAQGLSQVPRLRPVSVIAPQESDDVGPFQRQQQQQQSPEAGQSFSVIPMTAGMPPLSPLRIPSNSHHNSTNLLKLIGQDGAFDPDLDDSPQSPRMSVVGVSNSVINNLLSEEGIPLVPAEPGLAETLMDPVPETLELTPDSPKRVRSFMSVGGTSGHYRGSVPSTPRVSLSGTRGGTGGDTALSGTWSGSGRDQAQGADVSPLRAGQVVRGYRGQRQIINGSPGGIRSIRSDSNIVGHGSNSYNSPAYRRQSTAGSGSNGGHPGDVGSWDFTGAKGLRSGSSSRAATFGSSSGGGKYNAASRRGRGSFSADVGTPRAGRTSISFSELQRPRDQGYAPVSNNPGTKGDVIMLHPDSAAGSATQPSAVTGLNSSMFATDSDEDFGADVDMSAANIAAAASFHMSPPDDPNPSNQNNIVDWFEPPVTATGRRSSQVRMFRDSEPSDLDAVPINGYSSSSSSGQVFRSDKGLGSSLATSNMLGSGALFSRSGLAEMAKGGRGVTGGLPPAGAGVYGSPAVDHRGIAAPASLFATPVRHGPAGTAV